MNTLMKTGLAVVGGALAAGGILFAILSGAGPAGGAAPAPAPMPPAQTPLPESSPAASPTATGQGGSGDAALIEQGAQLYKTHICFTCHSDDGSTRTGPTFAGIFGHKQELNDGSSVVVDEAYIRESLFNPGAKVAKGFLPTMPSYKGRLTDREVDALIAYIKSLR